MFFFFLEESQLLNRRLSLLQEYEKKIINNTVVTVGIRASTQREAGRSCEPVGLTEGSDLKATSFFIIHSQIFYKIRDCECVYTGFQPKQVIHI